MFMLIPISNIMRDTMIVNISGLSGHFMAVDLNIETKPEQREQQHEGRR
jgi:hypothetical protein